MDEAAIKEWMKNYLQHRNLVERSLVSIDDQDNCLLVNRKDGSQETILCAPQLETAKPEQGKLTIVTLNTRKNLDHLLNRWQQFIQNRDLKIMFINPKSETEKKWMIKPYVHDRISEPDSLKKGLLAMFETVDAV